MIAFPALSSPTESMAVAGIATADVPRTVAVASSVKVILIKGGFIFRDTFVPIVTRRVVLRFMRLLLAGTSDAVWVGALASIVFWLKWRRGVIAVLAWLKFIENENIANATTEVTRTFLHSKVATLVG